MIQKDEGTGDKKLEEIEACKENIFSFYTRQKRIMDIGFSTCPVGFFQS